MRIERTRPNVFTVVATGEELSALVAGARMALDVMRATSQDTSFAAAALLERVLGDFDRARARLDDGDGAGG